MNEKLKDFYIRVLKAADMTVDEKGFITIYEGELAQKAMVADEEGNDRQLALPTDEILKNHFETTIRFHPLSEDFTKGPSTVVEYYKQALTENLTINLSAAILQLLIMTASDKIHPKLNPVQSELLKVAQKSKKSIIDKFKDIYRRIKDDDKDLQMVRVFLKRNERVNGTAYKWVGIVSFPFYETLKKKPEKIKNVTLTKEAHEAFINIFEYLFANLHIPGTFNFGSNSTLAPKFEAILGALGNLIIQVNGLIEELGDQAGGLEPIEASWYNDLQNTDQFLAAVRMIPMQPGNEGRDSKLERKSVDLTEAENRLRNHSEQTQHVTAPATGLQQQTGIEPVAIKPPAQYQQERQAQALQTGKKLKTLSDVLGGNGVVPSVGAPVPGVMMGAQQPVMMQQPMMMQSQQQQPQWVQTNQGMFIAYQGQFYTQQQFYQAFNVVFPPPNQSMMGGYNPLNNPNRANASYNTGTGLGVQLNF